jgi:hypothetical protein
MEGQDGYFYTHQNYYNGQVAATATFSPNHGMGNYHNSYSSSNNHNHSGINKVNNVGGFNATKKNLASQSGGRSSHCDVCQMTFPSAAVLENHVKGSRHARKLKSQQAFRQLKESGTYFRKGEETGGEIRCEVCQV